MKAAVITSPGQPPQYLDVADPVPAAPGEMLVEVLAAGLHRLTRARSAGGHYSGAARLPLVPGVDGVGRGSDGRLRYFAQGPGQPGTMAEQTVIELDHSIELPGDSDPVVIAAAMNPAMASWLALRCRVPFERGQEVLVLGASGSSGSMAVQITRQLGASRIVAAGRDAGRLAKLIALGATETVTLDDGRLGAMARGVDVVLDFVWGEAAVRAMQGLLAERPDRGRPLTWIHVGSMSGEVAGIPGAFLRSANLQIVGSGLGSVPGRAILEELPALAREIARGTFSLEVAPVPLRDVQRAWPEEAGASGRVVFVP